MRYKWDVGGMFNGQLLGGPCAGQVPKSRFWPFWRGRAKGASKVRVQTIPPPLHTLHTNGSLCHTHIIHKTIPAVFSPPPVQVGEHSFARAKGADGEALHRPRSKVASRGWAVRQGRVRRWLPESHASEVTVTNKGTSLPTSRHFCDMALEQKYGTPMMRGPTIWIH